VTSSDYAQRQSCVISSDYAQRLESLSKELRGEIAERECGSFSQQTWTKTTLSAAVSLTDTEFSASTQVGSSEKPSEAETMSTPSGTIGGAVEEREVEDKRSPRTRDLHSSSYDAGGPGHGLL